LPYNPSMPTKQVTDLRLGESLTIAKGQERITWIKKSDPRSCFKFRRMHFKDGRILRVMDNHKLGTSEDLDLAFLLDTGWKSL
jgi:hypothetical protein